MKTNINIHNYESFFIDFLDGNLNDALLDEFHAFLGKHPELAEELNLLSEPVELSTGETYTFDEKMALKKSPIDSEMSYENYLLVAAAQHEASGDELLEIEKLLHNYPEKLSEIELLSKTFLRADQIEFPEKASMRHHVIPFRPIIATAMSIAAALLLYFSVQTQHLPGAQRPLAFVDTNIAMKQAYLPKNMVQSSNIQEKSSMNFKFQVNRTAIVEHKTNLKNTHVPATIGSKNQNIALSNATAMLDYDTELSKVEATFVGNDEYYDEPEVSRKVTRKINAYNLIQTVLLAYNKRTDKNIFLEKIEDPTTNSTQFVLSNQNFRFKTTVKNKKNRF